MNRKEQFMQAVQILAPGDQNLCHAAERVSEEKLPVAPGGAALEFVVAFQKLRVPAEFGATGSAIRDRPSWVPQATVMAERLSMSHALRVKSAEYWLRLGQPLEALMELGNLPEETRDHPWVLRVLVSAMEAAKDLDEYSGAC